MVLRTLDPRNSCSELVTFKPANAKLDISWNFFFDREDGNNYIPPRLLATFLIPFSGGTLPTAGHPQEFLTCNFTCKGFGLAVASRT
jgi:hypothetical protein